MEDSKNTSGLDVVLEVWSRRKWLAILMFMGPFAVTVSLAMALPDLYRSTATLLVERPEVAETFVKSSVTSELETRLQTISQEILSRSSLQELITQFSLYPEFLQLAAPEAAIERMRRDIRMEFKGGDLQVGRGMTIAFTISFRGRDPETVAKVTNTLASLFVEENVKRRERQAAGTAEFLRVQLEEMKRKLDQEERRLGEFKEHHVGELPEQMEANLATLQRLNTEMRLNKENQMRVLERLEREKLTRQLAEARAPVPDGDGAVLGGDAEAHAARLSRLNQELTELRSRFSEKYPDVIRVKAEIAAVEGQLTETKTDERAATKATSPANPSPLRLRKVRNEAEEERNALKEEEKALRQAIATYQRRVELAPHREQEFQELSRDYKTMKELYNTLLQRYQEALVAASMEHGQKGDQVRLLDTAIPSTRPAAPNRLRLIFIGLILSIGLAGGTVGLIENRDTSFHSAKELRTFTKMPMVVRIPRIVTETDTSRQRRQFYLGAATALLGLVILVGATYYVVHGNEQLVWMLGGTSS
jgi:polysaccharide chain length determinant protein (PEP-CTERM system associated)